MAVGSRPEKIEEWTSRLGRYEESCQTIAQFCRVEGVSQPSFYQWKKKLEDSARDFQPVRIVSASNPSRRETIVRLGSDLEIELGSDLSVVECVVQQVLAAADKKASTARDTSC